MAEPKVNKKKRDYSSTQKLIKQVVLFFIIMIGLYIGYQYTSGMVSDSKSVTAKNARESRKVKKKFTELKKQLGDFHKAHEEFKTIDPLFKPDPLGYVTEASRIRVLQPKISKLKDKYGLQDLSLKMAEFEMVEEYKTNPNLKVANGKVQISFNALTDSYILDFIKELMNSDLPGYLKINNFQVTKIASIDQDYLHKTGDYNIFEPLLKADLIFTWTTVRDFSRAISKYEEKGGNK